MAQNILDNKIENLTDITYECSCGKVHRVQTKKIIIEDNALSKVYNVIKELNLGNSTVIIADNNTFGIAGEDLMENLRSFGMNVTASILHGNDIHADEKALEQVFIDVDKDTDFLIAVGSGTINDIARYVSYKLDISYIIIATAPSMDGYASTVSPLMINGFKKTFTASYPVAIIGDLQILSKAPQNMIAAGFGDMMGKITALSDWILAKEITGEYYCPEIVQMMLKAVRHCIDNVDGLAQRKKSAIKGLTEGLILSGIAMQMIGNSRPASGAEHHLAHYLEMQHFMKGQVSPLHGVKVGVATGIIMSIYKKVFELNLSMINIKVKNKDEILYWNNEIHRCFGSLADEIINENSSNMLVPRELENAESSLSSQIETARKQIEPLFSIVYDLKDLLKKVGGPAVPGEMAVSYNEALDAIKYARVIRNRYTILQLTDQIGVLNRIANEIVNALYEGERI